MKIRSAVPENGCLIFFVDGKKTKNKTKTKNAKKTSVKHIRYCLIGGCVNEKCCNIASTYNAVKCNCTRTRVTTTIPQIVGFKKTASSPLLTRAWAGRSKSRTTSQDTAERPKSGQRMRKSFIKHHNATRFLVQLRFSKCPMASCGLMQTCGYLWPSGGVLRRPAAFRRPVGAGSGLIRYVAREYKYRARSSQLVSGVTVASRSQLVKSYELVQSSVCFEIIMNTCIY